jgi:hypothetical protein
MGKRNGCMNGIDGWIGAFLKHNENFFSFTAALPSINRIPIHYNKFNKQGDFYSKRKGRKIILFKNNFSGKIQKKHKKTHDNVL